MSKKISQEDYIEKVSIIHNNKYDYSRLEYKGMRSDIEIGCPIHGFKWQSAYLHSIGRGCRECGRKTTADKLRGNLYDFIEKSNKKYNNRYDYSKFVYIDNSTKSIIICPIHGEFKHSPSQHLNQINGCPDCSIIIVSDSIRKYDLNSFIEISNNRHNFFYDYSISKWNGYNEDINIICPIHGSFPQRAGLHMTGSKCKKCINERMSNERRGNKEDFIEKARLIHGDLYNYPGKYIDATTDITINCKKHGDFPQTPNNHLQGKGCKKCGNRLSKAENEILEFISNYVKCNSNDRKIIKPYEIDIYIPDLKIGIEYNGLLWHSDRFKDDRNYHLKKLELSNSNNVKLIQIFEDEWLFKKEIVKSRLLNIIGKTPNKIYARKCEIRTIKSSEVRSLLDLNHIQGFVGGSIYLGLFYNSELVSVMTFGSLRKNLGQESKEGSFELLRFCNKLNTTVIGGASKLFKHFVKKYNPQEVISYADRRWSEGNLYKNLGFEFLSKSIPNYYYTKGLIRENRFKFRKSELVKKGFNLDKTEKQIMIDQGYYRIYDCGTLKFIWKKDS